MSKLNFGKICNCLLGHVSLRELCVKRCGGADRHGMFREFQVVGMAGMRGVGGVGGGGECEKVETGNVAQGQLQDWFICLNRLHFIWKVGSC